MSKKQQEPQAPVIHDSDLIYLAIKRLEAIAMKMQRPRIRRRTRHDDGAGDRDVRLGRLEHDSPERAQ